MRSATGGPAFPVPGLQHDEDFNGMTLRDYFAAKAMQGVIAGSMADGWHLGKESPREFAVVAYEIADAMLAARGAA